MTCHSRYSLAASTAAAAALAALTTVALGAHPQDSAGAGSSVPVWDSLTADLAIRHYRVAADGTPTGPAVPAMTMRLERAIRGGRSTTTLTLRDLEGPRVQTLSGTRLLSNPFLIARMEVDDEDGTTRYFDAAGKIVPGPTPADRDQLGLPPSLRSQDGTLDALLAATAKGPGPRGPRSVAGGLFAPADGQTARRAALEARFGPARGRVRGLDRFTGLSGEMEYEVLVRPDVSLPVEMSTSRLGQLVMRAELTYDPAPAGFLRRAVRLEQLIPKGDGARAVAQVEISNVTFSTRGDR
jgi:hypothetical protein